jgi:hypothetical protein
LMKKRKGNKRSINNNRRPSTRNGQRINIQPSRTLCVSSSKVSKNHLALLDEQLSHIYNDEELHNSLALYYLRCITDMSINMNNICKTISREKGYRLNMRQRLLLFLKQST